MKTNVICLLLLTTLAVGCGYGTHSTTPAQPGTTPSIAQLMPNNAISGGSNYVDRQRHQLRRHFRGELEWPGANHHVCQRDASHGCHSRVRHCCTRHSACHGDQSGHRRRNLWRRHAGGNVAGSQLCRELANARNWRGRRSPVNGKGCAQKLPGLCALLSRTRAFFRSPPQGHDRAQPTSQRCRDSRNTRDAQSGRADLSSHPGRLLPRLKISRGNL